VLVTGGAGFIGSHLVDALLDQGLRVYVLDDLSSGSMRNLARSRKDPKLRFRRNSVTKMKVVASICRRVEAVFHLAAVSSAVLSARRPELANEVNVTGTLNVLQAASRNDVQKIIFASSAAVYGNQKSIPISEDAPLEPINVYGASKLAAEEYCQVYGRANDLSTFSLRLFNVYGERQDPRSPYSGVVSIFAEKLRRKEQVTIFGDGRQTRDFIHVSDVVRANLLALEAEAGGVINVGTGEETSVRELYDLMAGLMGSGAKPMFGPGRPGDIYRSCADVSKAKAVLGFQPEDDIRLGLSTMLGLRLL